MVRLLGSGQSRHDESVFMNGILVGNSPVRQSGYGGGGIDSKKPALQSFLGLSMHRSPYDVRKSLQVRRLDKRKCCMVMALAHALALIF